MTAPPHIYPHRWYGQWRFMRFVYPFSAALLILFGIGQHHLWMLALGIFGALTAFLNIKQYSSCLVVTPEGVAYDYGGAVLRVPWADMLRIGRVEQGRYRRWEGILLRAAHWERSWWYPFPTRWLPQFVPLWNRWMGPLWDRELFDDLFRYAPWLAGYGRGEMSV